MASKVDLVLRAFVAANRPLVRLLIGRGANYGAAAEKLRALFVEEAVAEIRARGMKPTASAVSLLSGVHRKDLRSRELGGPVAAEAGAEAGDRAAAATPADAAADGALAAPPASLGLIGQVVGRWMSDPAYRDGARPKALRRGTEPGSFDRLVQGVSTDVGPRAVLDEMLRLQVVRVDGDRIELDTLGMVPRGDFAAMAEALGTNLHDHAAAACANLVDGRDLLEQAVYVDEITPESADLLHRGATRAWRAALARVLRLAEQRVAHDAEHESAERRQARVRFGVYFHAEEPPRKESE